MLQHPDQDSTVIKDRSGAVVATISREVVRVYAHYHGRGPTKAKTIWREGIVVCVLQDVFGPGEKVMVGGGRFEQVRAHRLALGEWVEPELREAIEAATERRVESYLSQVSPDGVAVETFLLGEYLPAALS
jgi:uncharacterized protein YbcI